MLTPNQLYWKSRRGIDYARQQKIRRRSGNQTYDLQEKWLATYLVARRATLGHPVRLLDFGCGFGRIARVAAGIEGVDYTGYDFSPYMVEPLRERETNRADHGVEGNIYVGDDPLVLLKGRVFDTVLSISVLIHNDEQQARALLSNMALLLSGTGEVVLIENAIVEASVQTNLWHAGCWAHDILGYAEGAFNVALYPYALPTQCIYILRRYRHDVPPIVVYDNEGNARPVGREEAMSTFATTALGGESVESAMSMTGLYRDVCELRDAERVRSRRLLAMLRQSRRQLREEVRRKGDVEKKRIAESEERAALCDQLMRLKRQMYAANRVRQALHEGASEGPSKAISEPRTIEVTATDEKRFVFDAPRDVQWAQPVNAAFEGVLVLFTQQWVGIRAAAGCFPGVKVAVCADRDLTVEDVREITAVAQSRGIRKVLVHGFSTSMVRGLVALRAALEGVSFYGVWHGTLAAWAADHERALAARYFALVSAGVFRRIHILRSGANVIHPLMWRHVLPNMPPVVQRRRRRMPFTRSPFRALFPSWNNTWKNLYTNLYAADASGAFREILTYSAFQLPEPTRIASVRKVPYGSRSSHFETIGEMDLCLNATVVDCHPMVELEALAVGTPTLRSGLDLDFDEGQAYADLVTVDSPHDVLGMARRIKRIALVPPDEMAAMVSDYRSLVTRTSYERYADFLES